MCAALFGLMFVCSTIVLPGRAAGDATSFPIAATRRPRSRKKFRYPAPSTRASRTPSGRSSAPANSEAIARGAFRSVFARSNAAGEAKSPIASDGGRSSATDSSRTPHSFPAASRKDAVRSARIDSRLMAAEYKEGQ